VGRCGALRGGAMVDLWLPRVRVVCRCVRSGVDPHANPGTSITGDRTARLRGEAKSWPDRPETHKGRGCTAESRPHVRLSRLSRLSRLAAACGQTRLSTRHQRHWQRAHLRCETQPGASARPLFPSAMSSRLAAACGQTSLSTRRQRPCQRAHLRCETQPGASAHPLFQRPFRSAPRGWHV
jgi:hypothetical protein